VLLRQRAIWLSRAGSSSLKSLTQFSSASSGWLKMPKMVPAHTDNTLELGKGPCQPANEQPNKPQIPIDARYTPVEMPASTFELPSVAGDNVDRDD
jgi:hypothetical protein